MARNDYTLAVFDAKGNEQRDGNGDLGSQKAIARLKAEPVTDVFIMSHGWKGDVPGAIKQYDGWTDQLTACKGDLAQLAALRPGFDPLMIGFHWPSLPWGDESTVASFALDPTAAEQMDPIADLADSLGGGPDVEAAVRKVFLAVRDSPNPHSMSPDLAQAYRDLDHAANLGEEDRAPLNPQVAFSQLENMNAGDVSFGGFGFGGLLSVGTTLSFWSMKNRAKSLGETAGAGMLAALQAAAAGRDIRFHLMGHSFGCIVVSAMLHGTLPVHSLVLVQGALSLWAYAASIPKLMGKAGSFHPSLAEHKVQGPIVTTQSQFDSAVGKLYPIAAGVSGEVSFDAVDLPLFGSVGTFGIQGVDGADPIVGMLAPDVPYNFQPGAIYNVQSDNIIKVLDGVSGAHSDIYHPEVGHLVLQAAMVAVAGSAIA